MRAVIELVAMFGFDDRRIGIVPYSYNTSSGILPRTGLVN